MKKKSRMLLGIGSLLILVGIMLLASDKNKASLIVLIFGVLIQSYGIIQSLTGK